MSGWIQAAMQQNTISKRKILYLSADQTLPEFFMNSCWNKADDHGNSSRILIGIPVKNAANHGYVGFPSKLKMLKATLPSL